MQNGQTPTTRPASPPPPPPPPRPASPPPAPRSCPPDQSPTIGKLAAALSKAQLAMESAKKDATNPHLRNRYADLTSCWAACRKPLGDNGLAVAQLTETISASAIRIRTILLHESGEWIRSELTVPCAASKGINPAQAMGSAISYGRRYGLSALIGISADDDDGATAGSPQCQQQARQQNRPQGQQAPPPRQQPARQAPQGQPQGGDMASEAQVKAIYAITKGQGVDAKQYATHRLGRQIGSLKEITKREAGQLIDALNKQKAQAPPEHPDQPF